MRQENIPETHESMGWASGCGEVGAGQNWFQDQKREVSSAPWQVLYHFAVGKPSVDPRLLSFEAYQHLQVGMGWNPGSG